jgi:hypothetical protein
MYHLAIIQPYNINDHGIAPDGIIGKNLVIYLKHSNETFKHFYKSFKFLSRCRRNRTYPLKLAVVYTYKYMDYILAIDKTQELISYYKKIMYNVNQFKSYKNIMKREIYGKFIFTK